MIANLRRLVIAHFALGLASLVVCWARPGLFAAQFHARGRGVALIAIFNVVLAWLPYILSGAYSCDVLPERDPKATFVFISFAVGIGVLAACLNLNWFGIESPPAAWLVSVGVTIALLAAARLCAALWRSVEPDWDSEP